MTATTELIAEARRLVADCRTYNFGMYNADRLAHVVAGQLADALEAAAAVQQPNRDAVQRVAKVIECETDEPGWSAVVIARAVLAALAVPATGEVEWEYGVLFPEIRTEASFVGSEEGARYFMGRPADSVDKYATDADKRVLVRRMKAGPWVEVTP